MLSGARRRQFRHNDWQAPDELLQNIRHDYRRVLIVIEGVYSMDGDYPDLPKFVEVKRRHQAMLMVDEAHSIGTMGKTGRGISEHFNVAANKVDVWMGTLSKAFGSCGGYIAGSKPLVSFSQILRRIRLQRRTVATQRSSRVAALQTLIREPERVALCQENSRILLETPASSFCDTGSSQQTPIVPVTFCKFSQSPVALRSTVSPRHQRPTDPLPGRGRVCCPPEVLSCDLQPHPHTNPADECDPGRTGMLRSQPSSAH